MIRTATFSAPRMRAELGRCWNERLPCGAFIGLNPGQASSEGDDATARKYVGFATRWGWGAFPAFNLWELVATDPDRLWDTMAHGIPCNPDPPDRALLAALPHVRVVCLAWGAPPSGAWRRRLWDERTFAVRALLRNAGARCVVAATTAGGYPAHLSRLPYQGPREFSL